MGFTVLATALALLLAATGLLTLAGLVGAFLVELVFILSTRTNF